MSILKRSPTIKASPKERLQRLGWDSARARVCAIEGEEREDEMKTPTTLGMFTNRIQPLRFESCLLQGKADAYSLLHSDT